MYNKKSKRKSALDDGCNPGLVAGAEFDGIFEIPIIRRPEKYVIPERFIPFSLREQGVPYDKTGLVFNEFDQNFSDVLIEPEKYIRDFERFSVLVSPDCSLYRGAPLSVQLINIYRNRAVGSYYQRKGLNVIPLIRWGSSETYTTSVLPEKIAFLGVEKHSIVLIGTYGCIQHSIDKYYFKAGLDAMLAELEPDIVLVYGAMPDCIFGDYLHFTRFIHYPDWTTYVHGGDH